MRVMHIRITAAILVSLSCTIGAASCAQSPGSASEMEPYAPTIETKDEGDPFGDPSNDIGIGSSPPPPILAPPISLAGGDPGESAEPEGWFTYNLCCLLKSGPRLAREAFCRSQADCEIRRACFSHTHDSPVQWQNWCYDAFRNE
jgi:hypothetical protein